MTVASLLRLGFMADFLSKPILIGYTNGIALTIIAGQLGKLLGITTMKTRFFPEVWQILTNLGDEAHGWRVEQLAGHGIRHEIVCNHGGKGRPVKEIIERYGSTNAVFIDDLAVHHGSVAKHAPEVWRLHMVAEPRLASAIPPAPDAHARIDEWPAACQWILDRFEGKA